MEEPWLKMIGNRCWYVSCGGVTTPSFELVLGDKIPRGTPLKNAAQPLDFRENRGSVQLLVWCTWRLQTSKSVISSGDQGERGLVELRKLVGSVVVGVECWSPAWDLEITFDNGRELVVFADFVQPEPSANQNWELSVPGVSVVVTARSELVIDRH